MHGESGNLEHHLHQILANVMHVALDRADNNRALDHFLRIQFDVRSQYVQPSIKRVGAHQHFRDEVFALGEIGAHHIHSRCQPVHGRLVGVHSLLQGFVSSIDDIILLEFNYAVFQALEDFFFLLSCRRHFRPPNSFVAAIIARIFSGGAAGQISQPGQTASAPCSMDCLIIASTSSGVPSHIGAPKG